MNRRCFLKLVAGSTPMFFNTLSATAKKEGSRRHPNIIWIISEDMGPDLGCWGVNVYTPNIDSLAKSGVRFTNVFGTASVCMPHRTAMITGVTQTTVGAVTMRPPKKFMRPLTGGIKPLPALLREYGYFTGNIVDKKIGSGGKDDWDFQFEGKTWDTKNLADLKPNQPFYAQFNCHFAHRPYTQDAKHPVDPNKVNLPPCYPDHPVAKKSWSDYLESIQHLDYNVGNVMEWLRRQELENNTIVFFLSDHGEAFLRGKYFLYDCSLNIPLIIRWPKACNPPAEFNVGSADKRLLASIDITAQTVACAGGKVPGWMHGRPFLGFDAKARSKVFSAADWYGGSKLKSRSVRTKRYKYIRNFNTDLSVVSASTQYRIAYHPMYHLVQILAERGQLSPLHKKLLLDNLPQEELYDLKNDPDELTNLADNLQYTKLKQQLENKLQCWIKESGDLGFEPLAPEHIKYFEDYRLKQKKVYKNKQQQLRQQVLNDVIKYEQG